MGNKIKITTIGGGTGSFTLLSGLKKYPVELSAIVSMADDGGSSGVLRDELGVLPPGDVRQCLVALSEEGGVLREMFNYRYGEGVLKGHNFGNIFLSTLEKITGDFEQSIECVGKILRISGKVIPGTIGKIKLIAELANGKKIIGEQNINKSDIKELKNLKLEPRAFMNPDAGFAIEKADKIVISPGNLFCSILPNFLVKDFSKVLLKSRAKKIYVCNLMAKSGHTEKYSVVDHVEKIEEFLGAKCIDYVIYNTKKLNECLIKKYSKEIKYFVELGDIKKRRDIKYIGENLLASKIYKQMVGDKLKRTLIRHDSDKIARIIYNI